MAVDEAPPVRLLLMLDSRSPAGAHSHSGGMEAAVTAGFVADLGDVETFCYRRLQTAGRVAAGFAAAACRGWASGWSPAGWQALDLELTARLASPAARIASRQLGSGLRRLLRASEPTVDLVTPWATCPAPAPHHPLVLGVACCLTGGSPRVAARAAALSACSAPASAAVRLLGLDPYAVHTLLTGMAPEVERVADEAATTGRPLPASTSPAMELLAEVTRFRRCVYLLPDHSHDEPGHHGHSHTHDPEHQFSEPPGASSTAVLTSRIGIGGPVGSGKTALVAALCRTLGTELSIGVVTNDIYTTEDAEFLRRSGVLPVERIRAVQTGACPHTAIRDDIGANLDAVEQLEADFPDLDLVLVESGGDNLTATFSYGLVHRQIFVIDVAGGDKVPRKGGPGVTRSDLLVINKTDLAPMVGADLGVMARDASAVRGDRPVRFTSLTEDPGATAVAQWVRGVRSALRGT